MQTQTIEVEGLPEGWKAVAYRIPFGNKDYVLEGKQVILCCWPTDKDYLIVEKINPRRIVLEETGNDNLKYTNGFYANQVFRNGVHVADQPKIWREVKETDEDPYLKLTKKDMIELIEHIKLGGQLNHNIAEFIKEKS